MALVVATLEQALVDAFDLMENTDWQVGDNPNEAFAEGVAKAWKDFAESGSITTVDVGGIPGGVFAGAGTGSITVDDRPCADALVAACTQMQNMASGRDTFLAEKMAAALHSLITSGQVSTDVIGTRTPPSSSPVPASGSAKGSMTGIPMPVQLGLIAAFTTMGGMTAGNSAFLAAQLAPLTRAYLAAAIVTTNGEGSLAGSIGTGAMT